MANKETLSRRDFLGKSGLALGAVAALPALPVAEAAGSKLPHRVLGRTGVSVPILAFGCGSRFLMYEPEEAGLAALNRAIDMGITYLDTAIDYGDGKSETRVGMVMKTRRKEVFLATKIPGRARTRDAALKEVEASLKRLQTDHVDLLHIHSLGDEADLAKIEAPDGVLKALYELRGQKTARFIGMTSHTDGAVMAKAIERNDLDCVQMASRRCLRPRWTGNASGWRASGSSSSSSSPATTTAGWLRPGRVLPFNAEAAEERAEDAENS